MPSRSMLHIGKLACLEVKMIGKPSAGKLHAGFGAAHKAVNPGGESPLSVIS